MLVAQLSHYRSLPSFARLGRRGVCPYVVRGGPCTSGTLAPTLSFLPGGEQPRLLEDQLQDVAVIVDQIQFSCGILAERGEG
jgi:hypothetical protein